MTAANPKLVEAIARIGGDMEGACPAVTFGSWRERVGCGYPLAFLVPPGVTVREAHQCATNVEKAIRALDQHIGSVTVHTEPVK